MGIYQKERKIATVFLLRRDYLRILTVGNSHRSKKCADLISIKWVGSKITVCVR